ncbi:MAG: glycosyltransferase [Bifidobacteriaceae bacterium]|nr:glycosyltransferase [Bifidobacteriaceae bacterium]
MTAPIRFEADSSRPAGRFSGSTSAGAAVAGLAAEVVAVVVTRGRSDYLPRALVALAGQTLAPAAVIVVDAGARSDPAIAEMAIRCGIPRQILTVVHAVRAKNFGQAVAAGLFGRAALPLIWLLHDDSYPAPDCLANLVARLEMSPLVAVAGPKQVQADHPDRLGEVGVTTTPFGRRVPYGVDGELDQGQYDRLEDVLAVGSAGMLVRGEVWQSLGGMAPALGPFRDGLEFCRRARLAGHRVVVEPNAVLEHEQASYRGLRDSDRRRPKPSTARSYGARRRAFIFTELVDAPLWALIPLAAAALAAGIGRFFWRLAAKDFRLAVDEAWAPVAVLTRLDAVARARYVARRTRRTPRRRLAPLEISSAEARQDRRDRRITQAELRRQALEPTEIEMAERRELAARRRRMLTAVMVVAAGICVAAMYQLIGPGFITGGALGPQDATAGELARSAAGGWLAQGLGEAGPGDPLNAVTALMTLLCFGDGATAVKLMLLLGPLVATLGAWFAAGAATRSVWLRALAALFYLAAPSLWAAVADGRLGAVVAHAALPWALLGVARAVGVNQLDVRPAVVDAVDQVGAAPQAAIGAVRDQAAPGDPGGAAAGTAVGEAVGAAAGTAVGAAAGDPAVATAENAPGTVADATAGNAPGTVADAAAENAPGTAADAVAGVAAAGSAAGNSAGNSAAAAGVAASAAAGAAAAPEQLQPPVRGSVAAAAFAGLAFAVAAAGSPSLLAPGLAALLVVFLLADRGRRARLAWVALPALALFAPLIWRAASGGGGWRALLADPGPVLDYQPAPFWLQLLGWPRQPVLPGFVPEGLVEPAAALVTGVVVVAAVLALLRTGRRSRAVRVGWLLALSGGAAIWGLDRVAVTVDALEPVPAWTGGACGLILCGWLLAVAAGFGGAVGERGPRDRAERGRRSDDATLARPPGRRRLKVGLAAAGVAVLLVGPLAGAALGVWQRQSHSELRRAASHPMPPIVAAEAAGAMAGYALAVASLGDGPEAVLTWDVVRGAGHQVSESEGIAGSRRLSGWPGQVAGPDAAADAVNQALAGIAARNPGDAAARLALYGIGFVLVDAAEPGLAGAMDATPGLTRVRESAQGSVVWQVAPGGLDLGGGISVDAAARLHVVGPDGEGVALAGGPGLELAAELPEGPDGRRLVLAERADARWRASLDGRPLAAADSDQWYQVFEVPAGSGSLRVWHAPPWALGAGQAAVLALAALLALPLRRTASAREDD